VRVKLVLAVNDPSPTVTVITALPVCPFAGVMVAARPLNTMLALGISAVLEELPLSVREASAVSTSAMVTLIGPRTVFVVVAWSAMALMDGGSFTAFTVREKLLAEVREPSLTVSVMVLVPFWSAAGVSVTVRLAPLPPTTIPLLGISAVLDELPVTVKLAAAVSLSLTVKVNAPAGVSSFTV